jgi:hypothetical protein
MSRLHLWISPGDSWSCTASSVRLQVHHEEFSPLFFGCPIPSSESPETQGSFLTWPRQRPRKDMPKPNHLLRSHLGRISLHTSALCRPHHGGFIGAEVKLTRQPTNLHFLRTLLAVLATEKHLRSILHRESSHLLTKNAPSIANEPTAIRGIASDRNAESC